MVLTIGLIVKNEARRLEKCLESLKPVREALETELIIVDTGSEDETVRIAEKYADEVRHFKWVKDFAAARNESLRGARGEWFMYIDADEWFGDASDLIEFFKSGEYEKYNSASYIQRNYPTMDLTGRLFDAHVLRLARIRADTKFVKPVHEYLSTRGEPVRMLNSYVHHTGYADLGGPDNAKRQHYIEILKRELEDTGGSEVITFMQLFDVYYGVDNKVAEDYCKKGIAVNTKLRYNTHLNYVFMKGMALARTNSGDYAGALGVISDYFAKRAKDKNIKGVIATDIEMYYLKALTTHDLGKIPQMESAVKRYNDLYLKFKKGQYHTEDLFSSVPRFLDDSEYDEINAKLARAIKPAVLLTLGLIVKNEGGNLEKCLESLAPIRSAVGTELIIVDTGSTDNTVEIAKKYADEVRYFEWVKDFAAARNASLAGAKGEWFMHIDADEWFGDCSEIIEFFKSGEYKKFNSAAYLQRNYVSENIDGRYSDGVVVRLTKILPQSKFESAIHEYVNTAGQPIKRLNSYVHHFGYLELNKSSSEKRERNGEILLKKLETDSGNPQLYHQLFENFYGFDNEKAVGFAQRGIKAAEESKEKGYAYFKYILRKSVISARYYDKDYEKGARTLKEYFELRAADKGIEKDIVTDIDVYALKTLVYCNIDADAAAEAFDKYSELLRSFIGGSLDTRDIFFAMPVYANDTERMNVNCILLQALVKEKKYERALEYRETAPYSQVKLRYGHGYLKARIKDDLEIVTGLERYVLLDDLAKQLAGDETAFKSLEGLLLEKLSLMDDGAAKTRLINELEKRAGASGFSDGFRRCLILHNRSGGVTEEYVRSVIAGHDALPFYLADIVYHALKNNVSEQEVLMITDMTKLSDYYSYCGYKEDFPRVLRRYAERDDGENLTANQYLWKSQAALFALKQSEELGDEEMIGLFILCAYYSMSYNEAVFKPEAFDERFSECLPKGCLAGYYCFNAAVAFENKDAKTCAANMRKAALIDIGLKKVVTAMSRVF
jgi:glycosyltransferase involved in cell wall biosynthesis